MDAANTDYEDSEDIPIWQEPRREPLGAPQENCDEILPEISSGDRINALEEEQEILTTSVFSLTSHLAQVEFRLRQILKAPPDEKDAMLKELRDFTSKGVTDARKDPQGSSGVACIECVELEQKMHHQRIKQAKFIERLKAQLKELEGLTMKPKSVNLDSKHRVLIEHLKTELEHSLEEGCQQPLSSDELRHQINCFIKQYADQHLSKEEVISKLQSHIDEMQKFMKLMKNEEFASSINKKDASAKVNANAFDSKKGKNSEDLKTETINLMRKASTLIQIFTVSQFGCSPNTVSKNEMDSTNAIHWGNLRARLEMSINAVANLASQDRTSYSVIDSYDSESEDGDVVINNTPLTTAVRKHLAVNLRDLLQHGLIGPESSSLVPIIGCFPLRRTTNNQVHIWDVILKFYDLNDGERFNSTPARKLSQSFNLDIDSGTGTSNKHSLLSAIGSIITSHSPYKRSNTAQFKAFVCAALNSHKLVVWLNIILKQRSLVDMFYSSTSYVVNTGFQDALQSLDRLTIYNFDLPVDVAVKQFQNIKDVFM